MANWISYIKDDLGTGGTTRDGMISDGPSHGVQLSQELPPLVGFTTIGSSGTLEVKGTLKLDGQLKDGDDDFGSSGQVLSSDGTDTKWVNAGSLSAGAASQVAINDDSNANSERFITFVDASSGNNSVKTDPQFKYNPSTNTITTANLTGTIQTAAQTNITSVGTLTGLDVNGTTEIQNGNKLQFGTATNNNIRGYIQATETNDAHLIIATSGGEDIAFKDGGVSGTTNMIIRGDGNVTVTGSVTASSFSGNASTATALANARNIGGVSFDGTAAINLPGVNVAGNQDTSGNAATATVLANDREFSISGDITANGIDFDGSGNVALSATIDNNAVDKACMANEAVGEPELHISNSGTNGQFLCKRSGNAGGLTWEDVTIPTANTLSGNTLASGITATSITSLGALSSLNCDGAADFDGGQVNIRYDHNTTPSLFVRNNAGHANTPIIAQFQGDSDSLIIKNISGGDYFLGNPAQNNGFNLFDGTGGVEVVYNGSTVVEFDSGNNFGNFKGIPSVNGTNLARVSDNITGTSGGFTAGNASNLNSGTIPDARLADSSLFVSGMIMMWSGSTGSIPSGWVLCNGSNSTPDLRNRFVIGAGSTYDVNQTGGSKNASVIDHTHSISHTHSMSHTHGMTHTHGAGSYDTDTQGNHSHTQDAHRPYYDNEDPGMDGWAMSTSGQEGSNVQVGNTTGNHTHDISGTSGGSSSSNTGGSSSSNTGNASNSNTGDASSGVSGTDKNLPPYYALCYIMKT